jgi:hypothetical protein
MLHGDNIYPSYNIRLYHNPNHNDMALFIHYLLRSNERNIYIKYNDSDLSHWNAEPSHLYDGLNGGRSLHTAIDNVDKILIANTFLVVGQGNKVLVRGL